jgi:signal transduction histidine kinase
VIDNGIGFTMADSKRSFGLKTMRERAASVNGNLIIHSQPDEGAVVECWIPCISHDQIRRFSPVFQMDL